MRFVEPGQRIKIEEPNKNSILLESYVARVEPDRLYIACPQDMMFSSDKLREGEEIFCSVQNEFGVRLFNSIIIDNSDKRLLVIDYNPNDYKIFQRRQYIRINVEISAMLQIEDEFVHIKTLDIGGGGIKFISNTDIKQDIDTNMRIILNENESFINICGKILKREYYKENEYLFFFTDIQENIRTKIIKKCIQLQAKEIRKKLDAHESKDKRNR